VDCEQEGIVTAASDVHHKDKLSDAPERKYDEDNLTGLCSKCHDKRTARGE
jgi:5-methylcytosine-specific restriction endonuclease McrA